MTRVRIRQTSQRRPSWVAPVRRARRAVRRSLVAVEESCRRIEESEGCHARRPRAATRHLRRANLALGRAAEHLGRVTRGMGHAMQALACAPYEGAGAPAAMIELTQRYLDAAGRVVRTMNRIDCTAAMIRAAANHRGVDIPDAIEPAEVARWALMVTRRYTRPWLLQLDLPSLRETIAEFLFPRRSRPASSGVAEGVRRVCRGRAPPRSSICTF
jgi:hypothetical protein